MSIEELLLWFVQTILSFSFVRKALLYVSIYTVFFMVIWGFANVVYNRRKQLLWKLLLIPTGLALLVVDVLFQYTIAWMLGPPKETTLSMRLTRYLREYGPDRFLFNPSGAIVNLTWLMKYRERVAYFLSYYWIERFATGHIGLKRFGYAEPTNWLISIINLLKNIPNPFHKKK